MAEHSTHYTCDCWQSGREIEQDMLRAVEALIDHARHISPSPSMHVYVADLERALGRTAPVPHKLGGGDA